ncbi:MAG: hypothetical protein V1744_01045 [Candidatus Altiarchaeota archaeon]
MKGHKVALGGSFSGDSCDLFKSIPHEGILQFSLVGREVSLQIRSENLDEVLKSLKNLGVNNLSILEWKKYGTTLAGSGSSTDDAEILSVSLIPSALGEGLRPLSVMQKASIERKLYIEMLANIEALIIDAGVTDALYALQIEKTAEREKYLAAVREATFNAIFNSGGVVGLE